MGARVGGARCARGPVGGEINLGVGVGGEERGLEREWDGRRGRGMGGSGILGLLGHADRRALIGLKSLYYCSGQRGVEGKVEGTESERK